MTTTTALVLLVLLQQPRRPRSTSEISQQARCSANQVGRASSTLARAGWVWRFSTTEHDRTQRLYSALTIDGVTRARQALRDTYGDDPTLILFANSMRPPVSAAWR